MKQTPSLEEKKRALLEQIHSSRETYRRMLTHSDTRPEIEYEAGTFSANRIDSFPRSMTMRWIVQHPYLSAAAMAAVGLLGTRPARNAIARGASQAKRRLQEKSAYMPPALSSALAGTRRTARTRSTDFEQSGKTSKSVTIARSAFTAMATAAAMLLRDPAKMRAAGNAFSAAKGYVRSRQERRAGKHHAQVVRVKEG